jgi:hypothetical protein
MTTNVQANVFHQFFRSENSEPAVGQTRNKNKYLRTSRKIGLIETDKTRAFLHHMLLLLTNDETLSPILSVPLRISAVAGNSSRNRFPPPTPTSTVSHNIYQLADLCVGRSHVLRSLRTNLARYQNASMGQCRLATCFLSTHYL